MKFYKRDPDRALAGMAELTLKQRGAYNSILDLLYSRDGQVPDDDRRVAKMISCHWREWVAVKADLIAAGKIWVEGGILRAKRVQETIKEAADFAQDQSKRASNGWQKRRNANKNNGTEMPSGNALTATATPIDTATVLIPNGINISDQPKKPRKKPVTAWPEGFVLTSDMATYSRSKLPAVRPQTIFEEFQNWHTAKGSMYADWPAAFRTWVGNAANRANGVRR